MLGEPSSDRWQELEKILVSSWELPAAEREAFWRSSAGGDAELEAELRELSAAREAADRWRAPAPAGEPPTAQRRIGPYLVDRLIGRGGMGAVYLAHRADGEFERQVAVKVIGLPFEIESFRERFRRERQILAGLSHPNIAHLLDGGTTEDGEIYLAMEYVDGSAIGEYAKGLDIAGRLRLFRQVCAGVQYAHQHLIVHRDIKPSNILVSRDGVPKLLDFGAAKLLAEADTAQTRTALMTVAYASPEQLRGAPASTLSDVFSLGALLYELGTGQPAFGRDLVSRVAHLDSAPLPLRLPRALAGDLDRVVRKALAFDPTQRYPSVEQLSDDVRRYQEGEPVSAHPPALSYRGAKFVRRHAVGVGLAAALILALAGATLFSIREARLAGRETARAQLSKRFLMGLFRLPVLDSAGRHDMTVRELLELATKRINPALGRDPAIAADLDLVLGAGLEAQQAPVAARDLFQQARSRSRQAGDIPRESLALSSLAQNSYAANQAARAWEEALESLSLWKSLRASFTSEQAVQVLTQSGQILQFIRPADPVNREYLKEAVRLARQDGGKIEVLTRASALQAMAESYLSSPGQGEQSYRDAYPLIQEAVALTRQDPSLEAGLADNLRSWGRVNRFLGHFDVDEASQREVFELFRKHLGADHAGTVSQRAIWAYSLMGVGKMDEAYVESQAALALMRRHYPAPGSTQLWTNTAVAACASCATVRFKQCEDLAREALQTLEPNPQPGDPRLYEARSYLGLALSGEGRFAEALPLLQQSVEFYRARKRQGRLLNSLEQAYTEARTKVPVQAAK